MYYNLVIQTETLLQYFCYCVLYMDEIEFAFPILKIWNCFYSIGTNTIL